MGKTSVRFTVPEPRRLLSLGGRFGGGGMGRAWTAARRTIVYDRDMPVVGLPKRIASRGCPRNREGSNFQFSRDV